MPQRPIRRDDELRLGHPDLDVPRIDVRQLERQRVARPRGRGSVTTICCSVRFSIATSSRTRKLPSTGSASRCLTCRRRPVIGFTTGGAQLPVYAQGGCRDSAARGTGRNAGVCA